MQKHLKRRINKDPVLDCEELFCEKRFAECWSELQKIDVTNENKFKIGALGVQNLSALNKNEDVDCFVNKVCGEDKLAWEPTLLRIWIQFVLWSNTHDHSSLAEICQEYLGKHKDNMKLGDYTLVAELFIFHLLTKQKKFEEAKEFLEVNQFLDKQKKLEWRLRLEEIRKDSVPAEQKIQNRKNKVVLPSKPKLVPQKGNSLDKIKTLSRRVYMMFVNKYSARWAMVFTILYLFWKSRGLFLFYVTPLIKKMTLKAKSLKVVS